MVGFSPIYCTVFIVIYRFLSKSGGKTKTSVADVSVQFFGSSFGTRSPSSHQLKLLTAALAHKTHHLRMCILSLHTRDTSPWWSGNCTNRAAVLLCTCVSYRGMEGRRTTSRVPKYETTRRRIRPNTAVSLLSYTCRIWYDSLVDPRRTAVERATLWNRQPSATSPSDYCRDTDRAAGRTIPRALQFLLYCAERNKKAVHASVRKQRDEQFRQYV